MQPFLTSKGSCSVGIEVVFLSAICLTLVFWKTQILSEQKWLCGYENTSASLLTAFKVNSGDGFNCWL